MDDASKFFLHGQFGRVAEIAAIPPENIDAFLEEMSGHAFSYLNETWHDGPRNERKLVISELMRATERMIRAIERTEKCKLTFYKKKSSIPASANHLDYPLPGLKLKLTDLREMANYSTTFRPVGPVHGVEPYPAIADMDLQPVAVMLQLVHPARPGGGLLGDDWPARMNESGRRIFRPAARATPQHVADIGGVERLCERIPGRSACTPVPVGAVIPRMYLPACRRGSIC